MEQTVFLFKPHKNHSQHTVVTLDSTTAEQLKAEGKATEISQGDYNKYRERMQTAYRQFQKAEQTVKESDNPYYLRQEVREYELRKARQAFETEAKQVQEEYANWRAQAIDQARTKAAQTHIHVSQADEQTAQQAANRLALNVSTASNAAALTSVLDAAKGDISRMTDAQKTALQGHIAQVIDKVNAKADEWDEKGLKVTARALISEVLDIRNMDLLAVKAAEQLPLNVDDEYRMIKIVRKWK